MANYDAFELTRSWRCWEIPAPAQIEDLGKALAAAEMTYRSHYDLRHDAPLPGDWCEIVPMDERLRIQFETTVSGRSADGD